MDEAEQYADSHIPKDEFEKYPNVIVFAEHDTVDKEGEPLKYNEPRLQQLVENHNRRVLAGTFSKITNGHTPDKKDKSAPQPAVKGMYGAARMCRLQDGRAGIAVDEYRRRNEREFFLTHPGRSVELWKFHDPSKQVFDPIAALGAEKAKLDLPMTFSESPDGVELLRYSAHAIDSIVKYGDAGPAVVPGATNSFVPPSATKERYQMFSPEDKAELKTIVAQCIAELNTGGGGAPGTEHYETDEEKTAAEKKAKEDAEKNAATECEATQIKDLQGKVEKLSAALGEREVEIAKYQREQKQDLEVLKADAANAKRRAVLMGLQAEGYLFPDTTVVKHADGKDTETVVPGIEAEMEICKYGAMNDEQFLGHQKLIVTRYTKTAPQARLFVSPGDPYVPVIKYSADSPEEAQAISLETRKRVEKYRGEGKVVKYADVLNEVRTEKGKQPHAAVA